MDKKTYQLLGVAVIILGFILLGFSTGAINMPSAPSVAVMDASLENQTGSVDVIVELQTPPGTMATVQSQDVVIQSVQALSGVVTDTVSFVDNALIVKIDAQKLSELAKNPNVKAIIRNRPIWFVPQSFETQVAQNVTDNRYSVMNVLPLWKQNLTGSGVVVAVVDTGINAELPIFERDGKSIVIDSLKLYGEHVMWHGTSCASCIASQDITLPGIAPDVSLLNVEIFRPDGSALTGDIIKGWDWVAKWKTSHPNDYVICSNSLGAPAVYMNPSERNLFDDSANKMVTTYDIPMICAAGNFNPLSSDAKNLMKINSPGDARYVLTVGAVDYTGKIAYFSCKGPTLEGLQKPDVVAPGVSIQMFNDNGDIITASGTSFATPLTAGVAALIAEQHRNYSAYQLENAIKNGASHRILPTTQYDTTYGYGLVDAQEAVTAPTNDPSPELGIPLIYVILIIIIIGVALFLYPRYKTRYKKK